MKRKISVIISCLLAAVTAFSFTACAKKDNAAVNGTDKLAHDRNDPSKILALVSDGESKYSIVVPEDASSVIYFAAQEVQAILSRSTGVTLPIVTDEGISYDESAYVVSIGDTAVLKGSGISCTFDEYGYDGSRLKLCGNQIVVAAAPSVTEYGFLYGAYNLLEKSVNYRVYAIDEIRYDTTNYVPVFDYDYIDIPDIALRSYVAKPINDVSTAYDAARLRLYSASSGAASIKGNMFSLSTVHSTFTLMSPDNYPDHPEWFSSGQLCFSDPDLTDELVRLVIAWADSHPDDTIIPISIEDNYYSCLCDNCTAENMKYGNQPSGPYLAAANTVASALREHFEGTGREVSVLILAYYAYQNVPSNITADDNVIIYSAPIKRCYKHALTECDVNKPYYDNLVAWSGIAKKLAIYDYATEFTNYYVYLNDWNRIKKDVLIYKDLGIMFNRPLGNKDSRLSPFRDLRLYVFSHLGWDSSLDENALVDEFMENYYYAGAGAMKDFYTFMSANYSYVEESGYINQYIYNNLGERYFNATVYPEKVLKKLLSFTNRAQADIRAAGYDAETEEKCLLRVEKERYFVIYHLLQLHPSDFTAAEKKECEQYLDVYGDILGMDYIQEGVPRT